MNRLRLQALAVLLVMAAAFGGAHAWRPTAYLADLQQKVELEAMFPRAFGEWRIDDRMPVQLISPDTQAALNKIYNQTLSRTYVNRQGERVMLSVAYGGDQSDATRAHRPEVCYPAQGFQILSARDRQIDLGDRSLRVRQLLSKQGSRVEPITYWITVGERVTISGTEQKLAQLSYSTRGIVPDGMLVRVSTIDANAEKAYDVQRRFLAEMAQGIQADQRPRVVGRPVA